MTPTQQLEDSHLASMSILSAKEAEERRAGDQKDGKDDAADADLAPQCAVVAHDVRFHEYRVRFVRLASSCALFFLFHARS